jgi:hypothetical protein
MFSRIDGTKNTISGRTILWFIPLFIFRKGLNKTADLVASAPDPEVDGMQMQ